MAPQLADTHLNQLRALDFVIQELSLYLDTHPNDSEAFALFQNYVELEKTAREKYVEQHGPLTQNDAALSAPIPGSMAPGPGSIPRRRSERMFVYQKKLQYPVRIKNTNPKLASLIISQYGGPECQRGGRESVPEFVKKKIIFTLSSFPSSLYSDERFSCYTVNHQKNKLL